LDRRIAMEDLIRARWSWERAEVDVLCQLFSRLSRFADVPDVA